MAVTRPDTRRRTSAPSLEPVRELDARAASPCISGLAVVDPPTTLSQREVLERLGLAGDEFAEGVFARCGVRRRKLELADDDFLAGTMQGRTAQVEDQLLRCAIEAVDQLDVDPRGIGTVISASLYSTGCPTIAHRLVDHYEMASTTDKYHVVGVGCASAVPLLRLAGQALHGRLGGRALVVAADSMSSILMRAGEQDPKAKTVGSAIFGDGCAAAVLSADGVGDGPAIVDSEVHQVAGTLDAVSLALAPTDSYLHLARDLPDLAAEGLPQLVDRFLERNRLDARAIDHWVVHPGGRRIIEAVQAALSLSDEDVALSWHVLAERGNVGTPSIFYVLKETAEQRAPHSGEHALAVTIGPGVTVGLMLLRW